MVYEYFFLGWLVWLIYRMWLEWNKWLIDAEVHPRVQVPVRHMIYNQEVRILVCEFAYLLECPPL